MRVGNPDGNICVFCFGQNDTTHVIQMTMHDAICVILEERFERVSVVRRKGIHWWNAVDPASHCFYFIIIICPELPVNQKIKLNLGFVSMPIVIHEHGFDAAPAHICYDM